MAASTSLFKGVFRPVSAMFWIPGEAGSPAVQNATVESCVAPINPEKCGFGGKSCGWVVALHELRNVTS